jgi:FemAB-related protein (PEP-CTERM system-associated)
MEKVKNMIDTFPSNASWNELLEERVSNMFYYDARWLKLLTTFYGYQIIPLTTMNADNQVTGFLPLCFIKSPLTGRRLVSLPFSDYCPLLATDEASATQLIEQALHIAREKHVKYLELRSGANDVLEKRADFTANNLYVNWVLPLATSSDEAWSGLRKPVQHQIKKSQKAGVQVRAAQKREDMDIYYRLHLNTRTKKHGMPAQSQSYFHRLWDTFAPDGTMRLLLAESEGTPIAGMLLFGSGSTLHYAYGASDENYLKLAPNNLLFWEAITWGCTNGYKSLDLGRTASNNPGLMEFKRRWGAVQEPMPYYYYPQTSGLASTSESSWKYRTLTNNWRKLPLSVAGPLGGYVYKHLG